MTSPPRSLIRPWKQAKGTECTPKIAVGTQPRNLDTPFLALRPADKKMRA
jgi:hypothetical protein